MGVHLGWRFGMGWVGVGLRVWGRGGVAWGFCGSGDRCYLFLFVYIQPPGVGVGVSCYHT